MAPGFRAVLLEDQPSTCINLVQQSSPPKRKYEPSSNIVTSQHKANMLYNIVTLMISQSALTALACFCSRVRPWTASTEQPARSSMRAYVRVLSNSGKTLILQVTGTFKPYRKQTSHSALTAYNTTAQLHCGALPTSGWDNTLTSRWY